MNERLDVICRSLELGEKGKEILCKILPPNVVIYQKSKRLFY